MNSNHWYLLIDALLLIGLILCLGYANGAVTYLLAWYVAQRIREVLR